MTSTQRHTSQLVHQPAADAEWGTRGRRAFFEYRDFGLGPATDGRYRAQAFRATDVMESTGWHYHECDVQFVYVQKGWVDLAFEDGRVERVEAGGGLSIPGGMIHNEVGMSEDFEALEFVSPADMGTVPVDTPEGLS